MIERAGPSIPMASYLPRPEHIQPGGFHVYTKEELDRVQHSYEESKMGHVMPPPLYSEASNLSARGSIDHIDTRLEELLRDQVLPPHFFFKTPTQWSTKWFQTIEQQGYTPTPVYPKPKDANEGQSNHFREVFQREPELFGILDM